MLFPRYSSQGAGAYIGQVESGLGEDGIVGFVAPDTRIDPDRGAGEESRAGICIRVDGIFASPLDESGCRRQSQWHDTEDSAIGRLGSAACREMLNNAIE